MFYTYLGNRIGSRLKRYKWNVDKVYAMSSEHRSVIFFIVHGIEYLFPTNSQAPCKTREKTSVTLSLNWCYLQLYDSPDNCSFQISQEQPSKWFSEMNTELCSKIILSFRRIKLQFSCRHNLQNYYWQFQDSTGWNTGSLRTEFLILLRTGEF